MAPPRRLPVLQNSAEDDDARPRWHWVPIGMAFALSLWLPLAMLSTSLTRTAATRLLPSHDLTDTAQRVARAEPWQRLALHALFFALPAAGFALSVVAAALLCGRFGARVQSRDTALSGALTALLAAGLTGLSVGLAAALAALLVLAPIGALSGLAGGHVGARWRRQASARPAPPPTR